MQYTYREHTYLVTILPNDPYIPIDGTNDAIWEKIQKDILTNNHTISVTDTNGKKWTLLASCIKGIVTY